MAHQKLAIFMKWVDTPEQEQAVQRVLEQAEKAGVETAILPIQGELEKVSLRDMLQDAQNQMSLDPVTRMEHRINALSAEEKKELAMTRRILDENLLTYHFQPIVSAVTGEVFGYEALMRPSCEDCTLNPYQILKYA